jgi:hypothetical protein
MTGDVEPAGTPPAARRPLALTLRVGALVVFARGSLQTFATMLPFWLQAMRRHEYGHGSYAGFALLCAATGLGAAYGLWWRRRRWARVCFVANALLSSASAIFIAAFGVGESGTRSAWLLVGAVGVVVLAIAGALVAYVWRNS